jgi:3-oxoacyl-ACP reductase-like protein
MDAVTKQSIGFGIAIGLVFGAGAKSVGAAIVFGLLFGAGFYVARKRRRGGQRGRDGELADRS